MAQVSGWRLKPEIWESLFNVLYDAVSKIRDQSKADIFISSLLTSTEKKMIAKRLVAAILIEKGATYQEIKEVLHLSSGTIARVKMKLEFNSEYRKMIDGLLQDQLFRKSFYSFVKQISKFFSPHPGKGGTFWRGMAESMDKKLDKEILR